MSILTDLKDALEAVDAARKTHAKLLSEVSYLALYSALGTYHKLNTEDTIAALVAVARAADELSCIVIEKSLNLDWEYPRGMCKGCEQEALCAALEPLVKEADSE